MTLNTSKHRLYFRLPSKYLKGVSSTKYGILAESMRISHRTLLDVRLRNKSQGQKCTPHLLTNSRQTTSLDILIISEILGKFEIPNILYVLTFH